jgi:hypothetical protein
MTFPVLSRSGSARFRNHLWEGRPGEHWRVIENGTQLIFNLPDLRSGLWYVLDLICRVPSD